MMTSMRRPLIAGNWKMHGFTGEVRALTNDIKAKVTTCLGIDIVLLPTFVHLPLVKPLLESSAIALGAQNLYMGREGAFTGEISGPMLKDIGCQYVLVGHSERRILFHESLDLIAKKFKAALTADLIPILCVGETQSEREQGKTEEVIDTQLGFVINQLGIEAFAKAVIAYEPVWAIGTGLTATPQIAEDVHCFIRSRLVQQDADFAHQIRLLYGGSMKPDNAASLLAMPNIDGGLIGGASLDANHFAAICAHASHVHASHAHASVYEKNNNL